jgi:HD-GYP domain-containing protein (c-di-GMP phosphodiesterase class II)
MSAQDRQRVREIGARRWHFNGEELVLLNDNELENLTIEKGTLTQAERQIINNHIVATIKMLEALPFPKHLKHVPEFAGGHHEKMDGSGYPRGLKREQMSVQARIMAIADIFEALTAKDRPYKEGKKLSESLRILGLMKQDNHIDPDLFDIFINERIYERYASLYLDPEQVDHVDPNVINGR